ncbi:MAG: tRNA 5-methoxyuridine(34)/uridine 5-oxyacetic acid(34) synthase CmoB [Xanthomonadales bacterium]|nr:tRNA 5-methoxyuridine(34)/uridine 5-oxyacetic acid(34) synthase CmoB [Xanthomonadales bacterium]
MSAYPEALLQRLADSAFRDCHKELAQRCREQYTPRRHGRLPEWLAALERLPEIHCEARNFQQPAVTAASAADDACRQAIVQGLQALCPWRKGPFDLHGVFVDTEWRSDMKWSRIEKAVSFADLQVLDVGSGNGYYGWRMLGAGAAQVIGIDPSLLYVTQFLAVRKLLGDLPSLVLPLGVEDLPESAQFDMVCSMGVLYHRRSPLDHLVQLRNQLRPGGTLVLETLVVAGDTNTVLVPEERYAKMRNVWFIPSVPMLERWLRRSSFHDVQVHDVSATTVDEQRSTGWMTFESLPDFLDPGNAARTIEGYPAPVRALVTARTGS